MLLSLLLVVLLGRMDDCIQLCSLFHNQFVVEKEIESLIGKLLLQLEVVSVPLAVDLESVRVFKDFVAELADKLFFLCSRLILGFLIWIAQRYGPSVVEFVLELKGRNIAMLPETSIPVLVHTTREHQLHL